MYDTSVRLFKVVIEVRGKPIAYPDVDGEKALALMEKLALRGSFNPVAHTSANGIDEALTLQDMRDIYSDF